MHRRNTQRKQIANAQPRLSPLAVVLRRVVSWEWFAANNVDYDAQGQLDADTYPSGNVYHVLDPANAANDQTYGYDELSRLTNYQGLGNTLSDGVHTYEYDDRGRLTSLDHGAATYTLNTLGQRVKKTVTLSGQAGDANGDGIINANDRPATINAILGSATAPGNADCNGDTQITVQDLVCLNTLIASGTNTGMNQTRHFAYDEAGHLRGEYDSSGNAIQEYVWFGDQPLAVLKGTAVFNVYTDHLNTPRLIADQGNKTVWTWTADPFGTTAANEDADGDGVAFNFNLRFPGQYFDQESGLHYNYFRSYDPQTGRYIESDPIGLSGGLNPYTYVFGNPVGYSDSPGLMGYDPQRDGAPASSDAAALHAMLDAAGYAGPVGPFADSANALLYASEGDWSNVDWSVLGIVPIAGDAIKGCASVAKGAAGGARAGKPFTQAGKNEVKSGNAASNNGQTICVGCGQSTVPAKQSQSGVTPPRNETHVDHIVPKSKGGDGSPNNGQILCRDCNLKKSDN